MAHVKLFVNLLLCGIAILQYGMAAFHSGDIRLGRLSLSQVDNNDPYNKNANVRCGKATYHSIDPFENMAKDDNAFDVTYYARTHIDFHPALMSVNRHGKPDELYMNGPITIFALRDLKLFEEIHCCVYQEPPDSDIESTMDIYEYLTADWLVAPFGFMSGLSGKMDIYEFNFLYHPLELPSCALMNIQGQPKSLLITQMEYHDAPVTMEVASWIDGYSYEVLPGTQYFVPSLEICYSLGPNSTDAGTFGGYFFHLFIFYDTEIHQNGQPMDGTYGLEVGRTSVGTEIDKSTSSNWAITCLDKKYEINYSITPLVFVSVGFWDSKPDTEINNPPLAAWVDFTNEKGFRACVSRVRHGNYLNDVLSDVYISYLVLSLDGPYDTTSDLYDMSGQILFKFNGIHASVLDSNYIRNSIADGLFLNALSHISGVDASLLYLIEITESYSGNYVHVYVILDPSDNDPAHEKFLGVAESISNFFVGNKVTFFEYDNINATMAERLMSAIFYPFGPTLGNVAQTVTVSIEKEQGCVVGPFAAGTCSSACAAGSYDGKMTINREILYPETSEESRCGTLTMEYACNLPPCTVVDNVFTENVSKSSITASPKTWLPWVVVGLSVAFVAGCVALFFYMKGVMSGKITEHTWLFT